MISFAWFKTAFGILKKPLTQLVEVITREWRGALAASVIWVVSGAIICLTLVIPIVNKYYEVGAFMGDYSVSKGERVTVSLRDLYIEFNRETLRIHTMSDTVIPDTTYLYPQFGVSYDLLRSFSQPRFKVGQRLPIVAANYIYTIELQRLDETSADTVAHFKVYRREYPETRRDEK